MINYNEEFFRWLEKIREIDPQSHEDVPEELQNEFEKLMFLADIPFRQIYGTDPEALGEFLLICLSETEYYDEQHAPLKIRMMEEGKTFTSPITGKVAQPVLFAEDNRGRYFAFLYCDWRGPNPGESAAIFDTIHEGARAKGVAEKDLPHVYFIYITDYDLTKSRQQVNRLDGGRDEPGAAMSKWHTIFFNAAMVHRQK